MVRAAKKPSQAGTVRLEEIKATAAKWFYRRGYEGTDLRRIAADIDIHPSSFYNYVKSKEELLYLVMKDGMNELLAGAEQALEGLTAPEERLRALIYFHTTHHTRRRQSAWTSYVEFRSLTGKFRAEILEMRKQYEEKWLEIISTGIEMGRFRPQDPKVAAYTMIATAQGISRWFNPRGRLSGHEIAEQNVQLLTQGMFLSEPSDLSAVGNGNLDGVERATFGGSGIRSSGTNKPDEL